MATRFVEPMRSRTTHQSWRRVLMETARMRLRRLLSEFRGGALSAEIFCADFEDTYNMDVDKRTLTFREAQVFAELFEEVVWFSPFAADVANGPHYRCERQIREAAERAANAIASD